MYLSTSNLSLLTDLIFWDFGGIVKERHKYFVVQHVHRPDYIWGNCLVLKDEPDIKTLYELIDGFGDEFLGQELSATAICWDCSDEQRTIDLLDRLPSRARLRVSGSMSACEVTSPPYFVPDCDIRRISGDAEWDQLFRAKLLSAPNAYPKELYQSYLRTQLRLYRDMCDQNLGYWYALYARGEMVSNLGIFGIHGVGRFQIVDTIPDARGKGYCQTLVYAAAKEYLSRVDTLVIVADQSGEAGRIYKNIGFETRDYLAELEIEHSS